MCQPALLLPPPLQVTVHVIVPAAVLAADPLPGAISLVKLKDAVKAHSAGGIQLPKVRGGGAAAQGEGGRGGGRGGGSCFPRWGGGGRGVGRHS